METLTNTSQEIIVTSTIKESHEFRGGDTLVVRDAGTVNIGPAVFTVEEHTASWADVPELKFVSARGTRYRAVATDLNGRFHLVSEARANGGRITGGNVYRHQGNRVEFFMIGNIISKA